MQMPDQFVYQTVEIGGMNGEKIKLEFGKGKNGTISLSVRRLMDILRQKFPGQVFEKIEIHIGVSDEGEPALLVTNELSLHLMQ